MMVFDDGGEPCEVVRCQDTENFYVMVPHGDGYAPTSLDEGVFYLDKQRTQRVTSLEEQD